MLDEMFDLIPADNLPPAKVMTLQSDPASHHHEHLQIVIALQGRAEFDVNGDIKIIGLGQGCIVPSNVEHKFAGIGSAEILVMNVIAGVVESPVIHKRILDLADTSVYFQMERHLQSLVQMLADTIKAHPNDALLGESCTQTIASLLTHHRQEFETIKKGQRLNIDMVDRYIQQHLSLPISVAQLAACVFLGESQFHVLFKQQMDTTPFRYVQIKRIEKAKQLIEEGHYHLSHIAELVGFSDYTVFSHAFQRYAGMSPSAFRKKII